MAIMIELYILVLSNVRVYATGRLDSQRNTPWPDVHAYIHVLFITAHARTFRSCHEI